jgi:non-canonical poly(A) RNA polymerase PAPD5/7
MDRWVAKCCRRKTKPVCILTLIDVANHSIRQRLGNELLAFQQYMSLSTKEAENRQQSIRKVIQLLEEHGYSAELFGSHATGLALAPNDIDIRVHHPDFDSHFLAPTTQSRGEIIQRLQALRFVFEKEGFERIQNVWSYFPLLDMVDSETRTTIQVVANNINHTAKSTVMQNALKNPNLLPIYAAVRTLLDIRCLMDVYQGGIGSYPLVTLISVYLEMRGTQQSDEESLAQDFLGFLDFASSKTLSEFAVGSQPVALYPKPKSEDSIATVDRESSKVSSQNIDLD